MYKRVMVILLGLMFFLWNPVTGQAGGSQEHKAAPAAARENEAVTAADAAVAAMNNREPVWVSGDPYAAYNRDAYIAAVGYGPDRRGAERNALVELTSYFSRSMEAEFRDMTVFSQAVSNGVIRVSENTAIQDAIVTSTAMDALVGAEIADVWDNGKGSVYAAAVMDRAKTVSVYTDMIRSNLMLIDELTAMSNAEKNTLDGYSRYQRAAIIANANQAYARVLSLAGNGAALNTPDLKKADAYRLEAANIAKNIPVTVAVNNDRAGRIQGAFAQALSALGFRSGGNKARYVLKVSVVLSPVDMPNQTYQFVRYVVDANLTDTAGNHILLPFNVNGREGRLTIGEAENLAVAAIEKQVKDSYGETLSAYLSSLLPQH